MKLPAKRNLKFTSLLVCIVLCSITMIPYFQVKDYSFVNFDDPMYVAENPNVLSGLTLKSMFWSFTTGYAVNWHPLTWISHTIDCTLFGTNAGSHHLVSLFFHILNSVLLFLVLRALSGALWRSALVAALFALHPLHVESVVWISERKDVLSAFFYFLTIGCYIWYVMERSRGKYLLTGLCFILALMAKPMAVTLPFVLLLLDFWPLNRITMKENIAIKPNGKKIKSSVVVPAYNLTLTDFKKLAFEKTPLLLLSIISCVVTFMVQQKGGAINSLEVVSFKARIFNAFIAYCLYVKKAILPVDLAVFYPFGSLINWPGGILCLIVLSLITIIALKNTRKYPYVITGWLWFIGTLVPVIGLVQVGSQAMADRYSYIPLIGIFIIAAWGTSDLIRQWKNYKGMVSAVWIAIMIILLMLTQRQVKFWENDRTLFGHAVAVTEGNYLAYNKLGLALMDKGRTDEAIDCYVKSLSFRPNYDFAHNNLGMALATIGRIDEAISHYSEALRINPNSEIANNNLGNALRRKGNLEEAIARFSMALQINPQFAEANNNLGAALAQQGKIDEAIGRFKEALRLRPRNVDAEVNLGMALMLKGKTNEAIAFYEDALRKKPDFDFARKELEAALAGKMK
jgi:protein O-mannosyl-transferase